jgi:hypothetical protein
MAYNGLALNDRSLRDFTQQGWWIKVTGIDGLWDSDVRDERTVRSGESGERSSATFYNGKTITLTGQCIGRDLGNLRTAQRELQGAFGDLEHHPLAWRLWNEVPLEIQCKKTQRLQMVEDEGQVENGRWQRAFVVQLRADDGRSYSAAAHVYDLMVNAGAGRLRSYNILGGVERQRDYSSTTIPRTRTYVGAGSSIHQAVFNAGNAPSHPVTDLCGEIVNPTLYNLTTGQKISFGTQSDPFVIAAGTFLRIDHRTGLVTIDGLIQQNLGLNRVQSDFWALDRGFNDVVLIPYSHDANAAATLRYRDAFL